MTWRPLPIRRAERFPRVAGRDQCPASERWNAVLIVRGIPLLLINVGVSGPAPGRARGRRSGTVRSAPRGWGAASLHLVVVVARRIPLGDPPLGSGGGGPRPAAVPTSRVPPSIADREVPLGVLAVPIRGRPRAFTRGIPRLRGAQAAGCSPPPSSATPRRIPSVLCARRPRGRSSAASCRGVLAPRQSPVPAVRLVTVRVVSVLVPVASAPNASAVTAMRLLPAMTGTSIHPELRDPAALAPPAARRAGAVAAGTSSTSDLVPQPPEEDLMQIGVVGHAPHYVLRREQPCCCSSGEPRSAPARAIPGDLCRARGPVLARRRLVGHPHGRYLVPRSPTSPVP